jgi:predicted glutamine amidotransferase
LPLDSFHIDEPGKYERERKKSTEREREKVKLSAIRSDTFIVHVKKSTHQFLQTKQKAVK